MYLPSRILKTYKENVFTLKTYKENVLPSRILKTYKENVLPYMLVDKQIWDFICYLISPFPTNLDDRVLANCCLRFAICF